MVASIFSVWLAILIIIFYEGPSLADMIAAMIILVRFVPIAYVVAGPGLLVYFLVTYLNRRHLPRLRDFLIWSTSLAVINGITVNIVIFAPIFWHGDPELSSFGVIIALFTGIGFLTGLVHFYLLLKIRQFLQNEARYRTKSQP